jgi:hypothetical protein
MRRGGSLVSHQPVPYSVMESSLTESLRRENQGRRSLGKRQLLRQRTSRPTYEAEMLLWEEYFRHQGTGNECRQAKR